MCHGGHAWKSLSLTRRSMARRGISLSGSAEVLIGRGCRVTLGDVGEPGDVGRYDAFVIGSAVYLGRWRKEAVEFVRSNGTTLSQRLHMVVQQRPAGCRGYGSRGRPERDAAETRELDQLRDAPALQDAAQPREHKVFFGVIDPGTLGVAERLMRTLPGGKGLLPEGDFRDSGEIESWASTIADELAGVTLAPQKGARPARDARRTWCRVAIRVVRGRFVGARREFRGTSACPAAHGLVTGRNSSPSACHGPPGLVRDTKPTGTCHKAGRNGVMGERY